jgi:hypothetical protein
VAIGGDRRSSLGGSFLRLSLNLQGEDVPAPTLRPYLPVGYYKSKNEANTAVKNLNDRDNGQHWVVCKHPKDQAAFSIVRKS